MNSQILIFKLHSQLSKSTIQHQNLVLQNTQELHFFTYILTFCWGNIIWLPITTLKIGPRGVISKAIKDFSISFSSPIGFEVEWHSSRSDKWYQSQDHGFELRECHCEEGIVGGITIWLPTTTLKTGPLGMMSKVIKDLSMSSSSPIGFEVEWHSSRSDTFKTDLCIVGSQIILSTIFAI